MDRACEYLTEELIQRFLASLEQGGYSQRSLRSYRYTLSRLWEYLPNPKVIEVDTCGQWRDWMCEQGFAPRTVNSRIAAMNSLLEYIGHRDWQGKKMPIPKDDIQPELTRSEYLRLLSSAKLLGRRRTYLLIKTIGGAGIRLQELPQLTAESVCHGVIELDNNNHLARRVIRLPSTLQKELLEYAQSKGITAGPIFVTRKKKPIDRTAIQHEINSLANHAKVDENKANPRALWKMYQITQERIQNDLRILAEQTYERMLENEQLIVGWDR